MKRKERFGEFVLDREASRLFGPQGEMHLRRQAFHLLEVLVESAPRVLAQDELLDRVWGVEHLSPASVKQAISEIRLALGDDPARPRIIETVHRRGYRFIAPLEPVDEPAPPCQDDLGTQPLSIEGKVREAAAVHAAALAAAAELATSRFPRRRIPPAKSLLALTLPLLAGAVGFAVLHRSAPPRSPLPASLVSPKAGAPGAAAARPTVAVLAFQNLSPDPETRWISSALSEILAFDLSASGRLRVVPSDSVARMRRELSPLAESPSAATLERIGRNLGTGLVIQGSYLQTGPDLRVQVLVRDARSGETVAWARETGSSQDLNELAAAAAAGILGSLWHDGAPAEATALASSTGSLRLYSEAQERLRVGDGPAAVRLLEEAVKIDPRNPFVFDSLAAACAQLGFSARAKEASRQALALAARVTQENRLAIAGRTHEVHGEWEQAAASYSALWQLHPDDVEVGLRLAVAQRKGGQTSASLATVQSLRRLAAPAGDDPRIDLAESDGTWQLGDFRRARDAAARAIDKAEIRGAALLAAAGRLARGYAFKRLGDDPAALSDFKAAQDIDRRMGDRGAAAGALLAQAFVLQSEGQTAEAHRAYETAIPIFRQDGDRSREAKALNNFASLLNEEGDTAGIANVLERSLAIKREIGDLQGTALTLVNLGNILQERGDARQARSKFEEAIGISRRLEDAHGTALALRGLARLHTGERAFAAGRSALAEALALSRQAGDAEGIAQTALALGDLERKAGRVEPARTAYRDAAAGFTRIDETSNAAIALLNLAEIEAGAHRFAAARAAYATAIALFEKLGAKDDAARARKALAGLAIL